MSDNPKCPYCGKTMALHLRHGYFSYFCPSCYSEAPIRTTTEEAYAAAMKRDRAKGEWIWDEHTRKYHCSTCGEPAPLLQDGDDEYIYKPNFCLACGADMREEDA